MPHNLKDAEKSKHLENMYFQLLNRFSFGSTFPLLDPIDEMEIESKELKKLVRKEKSLKEELSTMDDITPGEQEMFKEKQEIKDKVRELEQSIKKTSEMIMK